MAYKIIGDSCLDLTEEMKRDPRFQMVPLTLQVGNRQFVDDESFDQKGFIAAVNASADYPRTACPSPEAYQEAIEAAEADMVFVITLSCHLSGSYNSACVAKRMYEEEQKEKGKAPGKQVEVIDSLSASAGQLAIALQLQTLCEEGLSFEEIVTRICAFRDQMKTYFVLESLDTLRKNGRLSGLQAFFATALNIKPIMGADSGTIIKLEQARGINRALQRMCDIAVREAGDAASRIAVICHVNNPQRAQLVKAELEKRAAFRRLVVSDGAGVTTTYANDGGIVIAVG